MSLHAESAPRATPPEAEAPDHVLLSAEGLFHRWPKQTTPVLDQVTLSLRAGEVTWVGGRNGVGKTTMLRVLAGILIPQQGTVRLQGMDPEKDRGDYQRALGFLSAGDRGLHARMRVAQHLDYWARLAYIPRQERRPRVEMALEAFALSPMAGQRVDRLSQGWRQRVRLAMAFLHDPAVVLLDEPRNSLDDDGYAVLGDQVRAAATRGAAVLWCSPRGEDRVIEFDQSFSLNDGVLEATS